MPPFTLTVTDSDCAVVIVEEGGVTVTVGVVFGEAVTVTDAAPVVLLYDKELVVSGV